MAEGPFNSNNLPSTGMIPIRTVASLTGVNPVTLRAWERRYGLIKPVRTPKGHRLYTMEDVDFIKQIIALLERGMSISQVGQVLDASVTEQEIEKNEAFDPWLTFRQRLIEQIHQFDENALNDIYNEALASYPIDIVTSHLIVPLLQELGERWETAQGGVAEEHFFSVFLRNKLGARFHHQMRGIEGPRLVAACLPSEQHDVGLLLFALAAADRNYRVILLGADTPLEELPRVVERTNARAVVLSGSAQIEPPVVNVLLPTLLQQVTVPIFIGGKVTNRYTQELNAIGTVSLSDDLSIAMRRIDIVLNPH
jgi:DNA-binding transcriptional MerR regulator